MESTMRLNKFSVVLALLLMSCAAPALAGCSPDISGATDLGVTNSNSVSKFCDGGNLVYISDGFKSGGIFVVTDALECRKD